MKNISLTLLITIFFIGLSCKAQSPIINIDGWNGDSVENAYYKDINNHFNIFEGTWLYTNGNTSFKIVLRKTEMGFTGKFYVDEIIGEYQYIENGLEKANTLSNTNQYNRGIYGNTLLKNDIPWLPCHECTEGERRLRLSISDRTRDLHGSFTLELITLNGQPALKTLIYGSGPVVVIEGQEPEYTEMIIPTGNFTFIKQ